MAQDYIEKGFRKMILAGIGAAAITAEKSSELFDRLVQKGELAVGQGKALNEELKHNRKAKEIDTLLDNMTAEQMEELREKILQREQA
ncbi:MAG: hypothetical protein LUC90_10930 [Lachnospiraceae bacterium]|nr:hypothetical protein [Lachnospiraceae bacterium]